MGLGQLDAAMTGPRVHQGRRRAKFENALDEGEVDRVVFDIENVTRSSGDSLDTVEGSSAFSKFLVNDPQKIARGSENVLDVRVLCGRSARSHREELGKSDDGVQWRPELLVEAGAKGPLLGRERVRHIGERRRFVHYTHVTEIG